MIGTAEDLVLYLMGQDKAKKWELKEHREKRSLSQNAYYWVLVGKVAKKTRIPAAEIHNLNLRDMGLVLRVNDCLVPVYLPDTEKAEKTALNAEMYHLKPTSQVKEGKDGKIYRTYVMLRGSSDFNTNEMAALLALMVQEAKAQGIETMTPAELAHLKELENAQTNKGNKHRPENTSKG